MIHFITVIHVIVCIFLVLVILLQQGKKDGMGTAFGGGSQSVFGARGAETFLEKLTKGLAVIFMCTSLSLVYFSSHESTNSLLNEKSTTEKTAPAPVTATPSSDGTTPTTPVATTTPSTGTPTAAPSTKTPPAQETRDLKAPSVDKNVNPATPSPTK